MLPSEKLATALKTDTQLVALLGGYPKVLFIAPKVKVGDVVTDNGITYTLDHPYITYSEASDKGVFFADDDEQASEVAWNVSVLNKGSTTAIASRVIKIMSGLGYYRDMKHDMADSGVYVKVMRFKGGKINAESES